MKPRIAKLLMCGVTVLAMAVADGRAQSFSLDPASPTIPATPGTTPGTIWLPGPAIAVPSDPAGIDVNALSHGRLHDDFDPFFALEFSVAPFTTGLAVPGNAVFEEATGTPFGTGADEPADIFLESGGGGNTVMVDGDGVANPNAGAVPGGLGLIEPFSTPGDNVDGWDNRTPGGFSPAVFFSVAAGSAAAYGATSADVVLSPLSPVTPPFYDTPLGAGGPGVVWAAAPSLSLGAGDDIDAVIVFDDGSGIWDGGDLILLSLTPGSASLAAASGTPYAGLSAAHIFGVAGAGGAVFVHRTDAALGLSGALFGGPGDDVDALDITNQVIPEPGSATLLLGGLVVAATALRRRIR